MSTYPVVVTTDPQQSQTLTLYNGQQLQLQLCYKPIQQGWYIVSLVYQAFTLSNVRITNNLNILRQWRNVLPFGLGCTTAGNREPTLIQDFASGASQLFLLDASDVQAWEAYLAHG